MLLSSQENVQNLSVPPWSIHSECMVTGNSVPTGAIDLVHSKNWATTWCVLTYVIILD